MMSRFNFFITSLTCIIFALLGSATIAKAQKPTSYNVDSLLRTIARMPNDTNKVNAYLEKNNEMHISDSPKAITVFTAVRELAKKLDHSSGLLRADMALSSSYNVITNYSKAIYYAQEALKIAKDNGKQYQPYIFNYIANIYINFQDLEKALHYHTEALKYYEQRGSKDQVANQYLALSRDFSEWKKYDKALAFDKKALALIKDHKNTAVLAHTYSSLGWHYYLNGQYIPAMQYCRKALQLDTGQSTRADLMGTIGDIYKDAPDSLLIKMGIKPSERYQQALKFLMINLRSCAKNNFLPGLASNWLDVSKSYAGLKDYKNAYEAYQNHIVFRDSLNNVAQQKQILKDEAEDREDDLRYEQQLINVKAQQQRNVFLVGIGALVILLAFIGLNYFNQRRSNKLISAANSTLEQQRAELTRQRDQLNDTINELKATQQQLIQAEKMASLGELTAGIAHEIQNPLNFVNNFSEVSVELLQELKEEVEAGNTEDVLAIADDLTQNLSKIHHHGKRADGIVKGMLEHSRAGSGTKEPTDINKLADEYLRLAYHGLRAKDKSFNAHLVTDLEQALAKVNIIPQDIGRVLLNLFNNAFYAVQQRALTADPQYRPTVTLSTALNGNEVHITVKDNGIGIPQAIKDKIMQPFFTTKPTGEGTGLGLSISYDIVVKGHGGQMTVDPVEREGTTFRVVLPVQ